MPTLAPLAYAERRSLLDSPLLPWGLVALGLISGYAGVLGEALHALRLPDTDDAMRLAQVRDLVAGQSWFDMVQHRFLPPNGVASHWSRLVDAPLAGTIAGLTPLVGASLAERLTVALWPPLLFALYAAVLLAGMSPLFGRRAAVFGVFAATQTIGLALLFTPGRIDHHNVQSVVMLGATLCLMRERSTARSCAVAGGLCAVSLAVGLEALPLVALAGLVLAADWSRDGRAALPGLLGFGLSLWGAAILLFGLQTAPALWSAPACDALSPPWLWLAGAGPALALTAAALKPARPAARAGLAIVVGALALAGFALLFPACLHGPFAGMPEAVRLRWLERVREMQPLWTMLREHPANGLGFAAPLFAATLAAGLLAWRGPKQVQQKCPAVLRQKPASNEEPKRVKRWPANANLLRALFDEGDAGSSPEGAAKQAPGAMPDCKAIGHGSGHRRALGIAGLFLAAGSLLTLFQMRGIYVASALVPLVAGVCLDRALTAAAPGAGGPRARIAGLAAAVALNAQAWLAAGTLVERAAGFDTAEDAGAAVSAGQPGSCSEAAGLKALDAFPAGTVLAPIDLGPYLLVQTRHAVVVAPYHRAPAGLMAGLAVAGGDEAELHRQAAATGAAYLALCPDKTGADPAGRPFAARLAQGEVVVPWLEPLTVSGAALKVWRIR